MSLKILKAALIIIGIGWIIAFVGVFLPWSAIERIYSFVNVEQLPQDPVAIFWFRIACLAYGLIGIHFLAIARDPMRYSQMLALTICVLFAVGLIFLNYGLALDLPLPFYRRDVIACFTIGIVILVSWIQARRKMHTMKI